MKKNNKIMSEEKTRQKLLIDAQRRFGPEGKKQLQMMFDKYDNLIRTCRNELERQHIRQLGVVEIYKAMGYRGGLTVDDQLVIPDE